MQYILYEVKDFKLERDTVKYAYSRSNYGGRMAHGIGKLKLLG